VNFGPIVNNLRGLPRCAADDISDQH